MINGFAVEMRTMLISFSKKTWFFPVVLFVIVIALGFSQINGSSIGIYHQLLYGKSIKDNNLLFGRPRAVRSDEWLVATPLTIAQTKTNYVPVNKNIGNGIDLSLLEDVPTASLIQLFKPHNLSFFVLPVGIAFSLKWWLLAYFLVISVYLFVLTFLPKRKRLAILLSLAFLASPFIAWWYQYITLAPIYYTLFGIVVAVRLMESRTIKGALLWGLLLAYIATSFILVLYPPFQIPCALFAAAFLVGYILDDNDTVHKNIKPILIGGLAATTLTVLLVAACLLPKLSVIRVINDTAYPGNRMVESGGFNPILFFSSNASLLNQSDSRAGAFTWLGNQSEGSNFLLVFILLIPLLVFLIVKYRKKMPNFWSVIALLFLALIFTAWLFVPGVGFLGKITLLDRVLHARLLMGFGLINLWLVIIFVQILEKQLFKISKLTALLYSFALLVIYAFIDLHVAKLFPSFIGKKWALLLSLPYPVITYFFIRRRFNLAITTLLIFSIASVIFVHPLYRGISVLTDSRLSKAIREVNPNNSKRWVTDSLQLENYAILNGKRSLSGVYAYPDLNLWDKYFPSSYTSEYNRYAHVHFQFDHNASKFIKPTLDQPSPDQLVPDMEPCDPFLQENNVGYIFTTQSFGVGQAPCAKIIRRIAMPQAIVYIYELDFKYNAGEAGK